MFAANCFANVFSDSARRSSIAAANHSASPRYTKYSIRDACSVLSSSSSCSMLLYRFENPYDRLCFGQLKYRRFPRMSKVLFSISTTFGGQGLISVAVEALGSTNSFRSSVSPVTSA